MNNDDDNPDLAERGCDSIASLAFRGLLFAAPDRCCFDCGRARTAGPAYAAESIPGISCVVSSSRVLARSVPDTRRVRGCWTAVDSQQMLWSEHRAFRTAPAG